MKTATLIIVSLLVLAACARNPRPESPEQRAQQEARYLQGGEQAAGESGSITVREGDDDARTAAAPAEPPPSEAERRRLQREQARARVREARRSAAAITEPLPTATLPVGGGGLGILR